MKMTTEEAFVKVLQMHGIEHSFGIIGSAFMPISDLFPKAGITFWDVAHETNGGYICDGFTRASGKMGMAIAQNGPGITGFVTAIKTAYWNHTPMLLVTPQAANKTIGQGGFQEVEQMAMFREMVCYQEEVRDASRIAEVLNRVILKAWRGSAPAQINVPRDFWTQIVDIELPQTVRFERPSGGRDAIAKAAIQKAEPSYKLFRSTMLSWDNTARNQDTPRIMARFSIEAYRRWLSRLCQLVLEQEKYADDEKIVFINAWNEWAEGTHLEPDRRYGFAYLQATYDSLPKQSEPARRD